MVDFKALLNKKKEMTYSKKPYDPSNRFVVYPNENRQNEKHPHFSGSLTLRIPEGASPGDLVDFYLSMWEAPSDKKYIFSGGVKEKAPKTNDNF